MTPEPLLRFDRASVGWGRTPVLRDVSFSLASGGWTGVVGPNGCGKTTLLRAALGLSRPLAGTVVRSSAWRAGYVPQREALDPLLRFSAEEVAAMAARPDAWMPFSSARERRDAARAALAATGMDAVARRSFRELSGGQRQRVLIARALAASPTALVLDEPTNGMDLRAEQELLALIRRLRSERGFAVLVVTHSLGLVADEADAVGLVGDGRVTFGPAADILTSERLAAVWGCAVRVDTIDGRRVIRAERMA
ncbi:MAG: Vitamin B12 import ATP-binding protein BtuD [Planctomycetes bacterium]|nr:Vitamin B12 import ATP-binding protein BtuD [Planctomycetota bacterium]